MATTDFLPLTLLPAPADGEPERYITVRADLVETVRPATLDEARAGPQWPDGSPGDYTVSFDWRGSLQSGVTWMNDLRAANIPVPNVKRFPRRQGSTLSRRAR
jgi:hypothetical protein